MKKTIVVLAVVLLLGGLLAVDSGRGQAIQVVVQAQGVVGELEPLVGGGDGGVLLGG